MPHPRFAQVACAAALALIPWGAQAITFGQLDDFQDGSTQGWGSGAANAAPPVNVGSGGPAGAGDGYLLVTATGVRGPGGKLVTLSGPAWTGNYLAAGVSGIVMDVANFGSTDLSLRLYLLGEAGASAVSLQPFVLPAGSGWAHAFFDLSPAALSGDAADALANVTSLRLFHGPDAFYPGTDIAARLGVDNIGAVPEPAPALLLAAGLVAVAWRRRRRTA